MATTLGALATAYVLFILLDVRVSVLSGLVVAVAADVSRCCCSRIVTHRTARSGSTLWGRWKAAPFIVAAGMLPALASLHKPV